MHILLLLIFLWCPFHLFAQPILVGISGYNPPFGIPADEKEHFSGFEIDLMQEICRRAQLECLFRNFTFPQLFSETLTNHIDLAIGSISITPERQKDFIFSLPYLPGGGQYATRVSSSVKTISDIKGKRIGIEEGTIFKAWIHAQFGHSSQVLEYKNVEDVLQALYDNKVDAVLLDAGIVQYWVANNSNLFRSVGKPISSGYGIMANKSKEGLVAIINKYLLDLENDGTYLVLYRRYFN
ncbi:transporter substrate-binding domain-containing protein [Legionella hackeliae]|uniref:transporter substrate-binding domain-containing protein n=1 Tax=Legionella hackeliae TaxID=449 RepID=UPI00072F2B3F|nr:transporter substrate-binding domain-containing protein [Legionella hackeliae]KTD06654.1 arginine 3rd transport system periplasmic binding protein [Legionella hackeliae]